MNPIFKHTKYLSKIKSQADVTLPDFSIIVCIQSVSNLQTNDRLHRASYYRFE